MESGRTWRAQDIAIKEKPCIWMPHGFMAVNTSLGAGRAFLKSLYKQYADWGVDFGNFIIKFKPIFTDITISVLIISLIYHLLLSFLCSKT